MEARCPTRALVASSQAGEISWELASRDPIAPIAPYVRKLQGYVEHAPGGLARREFPGPQIVVILELGPPLRVYASGQTERSARHACGFVAGVDDAFTLTRHEGKQSGIQLDLHPLGARRLLGVPLSELRSKAVGLTDVFPRDAARLTARLLDAPSWDLKFDILEAFLLRRFSDSAPESPVVAWALRRIAETGGAIALGELQRQIGYSRKHTAALFHDQVGVPPKLWARLVRFDRLRREIATASQGRNVGLAELALRCGYYDQSHLARDVRQFTGGTPSQLYAPVPGLEPAVVR